MLILADCRIKGKFKDKIKSFSLMGRLYIKEKLPIIYIKKLFEIWLFKGTNG